MLAWAAPASAATLVSGAISQDTTWTAAGSPYVLTANTTVNAGVTLTVDTGVVIKIKTQSAILTVNGGLNATGATFTSYLDDSAGGDTNGDGGLTVPQNGDWGRISYSSGSSGFLNGCTVRYGGSSYAQLSITSSPAISNSTITNSGSIGIGISGSTSTAPPSITYSTIANNNGDGVNSNKNLTNFSGNSFTGNTGMAVYASGIDATVANNTYSGNGMNGMYLYGDISASTTWAASNSPYVIQGIHGGSIGNKWLEVMSGATLTIEPATTVKFFMRASNLSHNSDNTVNISGGLVADGVTFTSFRDDAAAGDTNGDGSATAPQPGDWSGISYYTASAGGSLNGSAFRYGGSYSGYMLSIASTIGVSVAGSTVEQGLSGGISNSGAAAISACTIRNNAGDGVNSNKVLSGFSGNSITNNTGKAVYAPGIDATVANNTYSGNGMNAMYLYSDISAGTTWRASNSPYVIQGQNGGQIGNKWLDVDAGATLTIEPGSTVKFFMRPSNESHYNDNKLNIAGGLVADGVTFTSFRDDAAAGDTNGDGSATAPQPGDWSGISYYTASAGGSLNGSAFRYGGSYSSYVLYVGGSTLVSIAGSTIELNSSGGIGDAGSTAISACTIRNNAGDGVHSSKMLSGLSGNSITNNTGIAVYAPGIDPSVANNTYSGNGMNGMYLYDDVTQSTTWAASNSPYVIQGIHGGMIGNKWMEVVSGSTLTIGSGATVKFFMRPSSVSHYNDNRLNITGGLVADGVTFTSFNDDSAGGDTNGDGNASIPQPGDWSSVDFNNSLSFGSLNGSAFRYGGIYAGQQLGMNTSNPVPLMNAYISNSYSGGVYVGNGGNPAIVATTFAYNGGFGLKSTAPLSNVSGNNFVSNAGIAVTLPAGLGTGVFNNSYYGNQVNAMHLTGNVSAPSVWPVSNSPYVVEQATEINAPLSIQPGSAVKLAVGMNVYSRLEATDVFFTSEKDDGIGGDTNADGAATAPAPGDWTMIRFGVGGSGWISGCYVLYGGQGSTSQLQIDGASPAIDNNLIANSLTGAIYITSSANPAVTRNTVRGNGTFGLKSQTALSNLSGNVFESNGDLAVRMPTEIGPGVNNNRYSGNRFNGMFLYGDISAASDWQANNTPYVIENSIRVDAALTIHSGSVVKLGRDSYTDSINVISSLDADGTVFTSFLDDDENGDTNGDGGATTHARGNWNRINFGRGSSGSLTGCVIKYGGGSSAGEIFIDSSPQITGNAVTESATAGIAYGEGSPVIYHNDIYANNTGLNNFGTTRLNATANWWGEEGGPAPYGSGNGILPTPDPDNEKVIVYPWSLDPYSIAGRASPSYPDWRKRMNDPPPPVDPGDAMLMQKHVPELRFTHDINSGTRSDFEPRTVEFHLSVPGTKFVLEGTDPHIEMSASIQSLLNYPGGENSIDLPGTINCLECGHYATDYLNQLNSNPSPVTAYARVYRDETGTSGKTVIQYWFLYYFNNFYNKHEGDWEMVEVIYGNGPDPESVAYSQHGKAFKKNWTDPGVKKNGNSPIVYVAAGSHANYFSPGEHVHVSYEDPRNDPPYNDFTAYRSSILPTIDSQSLNNPYGWLHYEGHWGQRGLGVLLEDGPRGPQFQGDAWSYPVRWANTTDYRADANATSATVHSPADIHLYDLQGRHVGKNAAGGIDMQIPGSEYFERDDDSKTIVLHGKDVSDGYSLRLVGTGSGTMDVDIDAPDFAGNTLNRNHYLQVPVTPDTRAEVILDQGANYEMLLDPINTGEIQHLAPSTSETLNVDFTPPAAITDLAAVADTTNNVINLNWTAPGDDGNDGSAQKYEIRYANAPITEDSWMQSQVIESGLTPQPAGSGESYTVENLDPLKKYYFAIKAVDDINAHASLSNVVSARILCTGKPDLKVARTRIYWASYTEYQARLLSVDYALNNIANDAENATVVGIINTNGVSTYTLMPKGLGNIAAGGNMPFTIKYTIPPNTTTFVSSIYATADDPCGNHYEYPGPYPGT